MRTKQSLFYSCSLALSGFPDAAACHRNRLPATSRKRGISRSQRLAAITDWDLKASVAISCRARQAESGSLQWQQNGNQYSPTDVWPARRQLIYVDGHAGTSRIDYAAG